MYGRNQMGCPGTTFGKFVCQIMTEYGRRGMSVRSMIYLSVKRKSEIDISEVGKVIGGRDFING